MRRWERYVVRCWWVILLLIPSVGLGSDVPLPARSLIVGTKQAPPFAMKRADGTWYGISIDLWQALAAELQVTYEWRELDLQGLLQGVEEGTLDVAVAALTITPERENRLDFTHPFYTTGLSIASRTGSSNRWWDVVRRFVSWQFLQVVAALALLLVAVGILVWLFERKKNPQHFGGGSLRGITSGIWWTAVTMTTVGYGDKTPTTLCGRLLGLIWMFAGLILIASFTAAITTTLTVTELASQVRGPNDLAHVKVVTIANSTSETYLQRQHLNYHPYATLAEALQAVARGQMDAVVYDAPLLRYFILSEFQGVLDTLPNTFERQDYGIAIPAGNPLRELLNRVLLHHLRQPAWQDTLYHYLGS